MKRRDAARFPLLIELLEFVSHGDRRARTRPGILIYSAAADVAPDRHDGVADELVQGAIVLEYRRSHPAQVFVQLRDELFRVRAFGEGCEPDNVREQDGGRKANL